MTKNFLLHVLRNPHGHNDNEVRKARLIAANIIDKLPAVVVHYYEKQYEIDNGKIQTGRNM